MAGDLEDFLRRAAERRKQKAQGGAAPRPQPPQQYTDQRTERQTRQEPNDVVMAEVVEADHTFEARKQQTAQAKRLAQRARAEVAQKERKLAQVEQAAKDVKRQAKIKKKAIVAAAPAPVGSTADQLVEMLRKPGGIQQAILLREILERPQHRW